MTTIIIIVCSVVLVLCFLVGLVLGYLYCGRDVVSRQDAESLVKKREDQIQLLHSRLHDQKKQHEGYKRTKKWQHERLKAIQREVNMWLKGEAKEN